MTATRTTSDARPTSGRAGRAAAGVLLLIALFQLALALGAPWGQAAWGGTHDGTLPTGLRVGSAVAIVVYLLIAAVATGRLLHGRAARRFLLASSILVALGVLANAASPSMVEKLIWTPVTLVLTFLLWRASREA